MSSFYGGGGGGSPAGNFDNLEIFYICSNNEYNIETGIPILQSPKENTFYLVPNNTNESNNIFNEYIYKNNVWELIGGANIEKDDYITNSEIDDIFDLTNDPIVDVGQVDYMII